MHVINMARLIPVDLPPPPSGLRMEPLDIEVKQYAANGGLCHTDFEDDLPAYALLLHQKGSRTTPSLFFQAKTVVEAYVTYLTTLYPNGPQSVQGLVPPSVSLALLKQHDFYIYIYSSLLSVHLQSHTPTCRRSGDGVSACLDIWPPRQLDACLVRRRWT